MTVSVRQLLFADAREAADLAAFLGRLLHYDRAAAVRLQAGGGALAVFGRPPSFEVLAVRTARLADTAETGTFDVTVSAGELLETLEESTGSGRLPASVTGPPWTGLLPPRGGWREQPGLPDPTALRAALSGAVEEFRTRDAALAEDRRTRTERDRIGHDIWSRTVGDTDLPLRAVHAAQSLGFLRPAPDLPVALLAAGSWLRLRTPFGSVALRGAGPGPGPGLGGLSVTVSTG
ncbi:hypothetical protein PZB75_08685 [Streptomyces sp. AM 4-1-1]|uniref:hypothetical protein n=1 Tax=unclassified Streptomyces TaxID=2593676 RepID=UPI0023B9D146|nr:hypothetical protein [Streptomyces sp. AM 4-1-1]WEH33451.1 hypothetical protein PZB75_08685 [Streptomyces sp. AM 4-1-1]